MSSKDKKIQREGLTTQEYSFKHALPIQALITNDSNDEKSLQSKLIINTDLNEDQRTILKAYHDLKLLNVIGNKLHIHEEVRKLDYLYWLNEKLSSLGFTFTEHNEYKDESHKIITDNFISTNKKNINILDVQNYKIDNFYLYLSITMICKGYISKGYIYIKDIDDNVFKIIESNLSANGISLTKLYITKDVYIVRIKSKKDCEKLKKNLEEFLEAIPCFSDKFYLSTPKVTITKKLVFDSAHYITDHDGKCKNLHGGRYDIEISIKDRIDPMTGFVIDYSLIKNITKNLVINKFDHKTLNLTCPELSWRSSTEFLAIVIWEILIEYLPNLKKIKIYETETSYCEFKGNDLDEYLKSGPSEILGYFKNLVRDQQEKENIIG
ncbi:6-carboxytetrahydropterin synthase [Gammaproteobacteria bacterium]|nr:6-carboxytetrahydropterin synthase [Gammaproteobacteria bacterium]